jgi:anti-sigma-K factor RskA
MSSTDIHALVGAYALDAVDDIERASFDRHLTDCEICKVELAELRETAARLADSTWSAPPPRMRAEVMATIRQTRQLAPAAPRPANRPSRWRRYTAAAAAAVVLAGGAGAATWAIQDQRVRDERAVAAAAQQREARTRAILAAPDLVVRTAPMVGGGKVTVASSAQANAGVVLFGADAAPGDGRVFQLWTIRGKTATSAGVLALGQDTAVQIVDGLPGSDQVAVTVEPAGGSAQPTTTPIAGVLLT